MSTVPTAMKIVRFNLAKHYDVLRDMLVKNNQPVLPPHTFPRIGFLAYEGSVCIASAFLRKVEGGYAQLDGLCTNPEQPGHLRHIAIDKVVQCVLKRAAVLGLAHVMAFSVDAGTIERSKKHGFVQLPHSLIAVDLNKG